MSNQLGLFDLVSEPEPIRIDLVQELDAIVLDKDKPGAGLLDLLPPDVVLEICRNYETREIHVNRILGLFQKMESRGIELTRDEIGEHLSVPKALAEGTSNVMRRLELIDARSRVTPWGALVHARCPYLDDSGLLWLLHYLLASNARLLLWSALFDIMLYQQDEITSQDISEFLQPLQGRWSERSLHKKAIGEINAIFKTYTQALFSRLNLVQKTDKAAYFGFRDTGVVPAYIWLSALLIYRDRYYPGAASLEIPLIVRGHYSPGRILRQNEVSVRRALDTLHNGGLLTVETRSGLDQVRFKREHTWLSAATRHLQGESAG